MREERHNIERYPSIELSDQEHLALMDSRRPRPPIQMVNEETSQQKSEINATSKSETSLEKPKKNHTRANKSAVAKVQKKLS